MIETQRRPRSNDLPSFNTSKELTLFFEENLFGSLAVVNEITSNGQNKSVVLEKIGQLINSLNPGEKTKFIRDHLEGLSNPDPESVNQGKVILELLRVTGLTDIKPKKLSNAYSGTVYDLSLQLAQKRVQLPEQTRTLLQAGLIICPFIHHDTIGNIVTVWNKVTNNTTIEDLSSEIEESLTVIKSLVPIPEPKLSEENTKIRERMMAGETTEKIAFELGMSANEINYRRKKIRSLDPSVPDARTTVKQPTEKEQRAIHLVNEGHSDDKIGREIGMEKVKASRLVSKLRKQGHQMRRRKRGTKPKQQ